MKKITILSFLLFAFVSNNAIFGQAAKPAASKPAASKPAASKPVVGLEIGNLAPDIKLQNPEGKMLSLSSLRGQIVLIDFWASWCGPCRMENPNVVKAYKKYKEAKFKSAKGFTIYSVSLDKAKDPWLNAINQDGLTWPNHVSDLKWWYSDAAHTYGVQSIPTNWLLDGNGVIIAKNLRGPSLDQEIENITIK